MESQKKSDLRLSGLMNCNGMCFFPGESAVCHTGGDCDLLCRRYLHRAGDSAASELSARLYLSGEWAESGRGCSAVAQLDASAQHVPHTPGTGSRNVLALNLLR